MDGEHQRAVGDGEPGDRQRIGVHYSDRRFQQRPRAHCDGVDRPGSGGTPSSERAASAAFAGARSRTGPDADADANANADANPNADADANTDTHTADTDTADAACT
jgi:hypothetical protein